MDRYVGMGLFDQLARLGSVLALAALTSVSIADDPKPTPPTFPIRIETAPSKFPHDAGQRAIDRPTFAGRVVSAFDFEETTFNAEDVPRHWFRAQDLPPGRVRPGFPPWNAAIFDHTTGFSGTSSVKLPVNGGSTSLRLAGGLTQIFPDAEYRVSAKIKTKDLVHSAALLEVSLLDAQLRPIPGGIIRSQPVRDAEDWTEIAVTLRGPFPNARSVSVDLLVLQPSQLGSNGSQNRFLPEQQDYTGAAWFDDVLILQLPRVRLSTKAPANTFVAPSTPSLTAQVRDLTGEELKAEVTVFDIDGNIVDRQPVLLPRGGSELRIVPRLPRFGWYQVRMSLTEVNGLSTNTGALATTSILYLAQPSAYANPANSAAAARPFSVLSDQLTPENLGVITDIVSFTGVSRVSVPAPLGDRSPTNDPAKSVISLLNRGNTNPAEYVLSLTELPQDFADRFRIDGADPLSLAVIDINAWSPVLADLIGPYAQRVNSWQIGLNGRHRFGDDIQILNGFNKLRQGLHKLSPNPKLILPWRADDQWLASPNAPRPFGAVELFIPTSYGIDTIPRLIDSLSPVADEPLDLTYVIESIPHETFGRRAQLNDFMQRALLVWGYTNPKNSTQSRAKIAALDPWTIAAGTDRAVQPGPALGAMAILAHATEGRKVVGELPVAENGRVLILAPADDSTAIGSLNIGSGGLIAWCSTGDNDTATFTGYFGGGNLTATDPFGNRTTIAPDKGTGRHTITVGATPQIIDGVDAHLVKFLADIKITPPFVPAVIATHEGEVILKNPWNTRISGDVQLFSPDAGGRRDKEWTFAPSAPIPFSIAPGQVARLPFSFIFSTAEEAGPKLINMMVRLSADRSYPAMRVAKTINIGLEDLDLQAIANLGPREDGPNVIITTTVTNSGKLTRTLQVSTHAPGFAAQTQPIVDLGPGESAVRRFVLPNGAEALAGRKVRVLMVDIEGSERLTKFATVPN